jgi:hypothetical protein
VAPIAARTDLGFQGSTVPGSATIPAAPSASAVRASVPKLPGSCTASSTSTAAGSPLDAQRVQRRPRGISAMARTPCGDSVPASDRERAVVGLPIDDPAADERLPQ